MIRLEAELRQEIGIAMHATSWRLRELAMKRADSLLSEIPVATSVAKQQEAAINTAVKLMREVIAGKSLALWRMAEPKAAAKLEAFEGDLVAEFESILLGEQRRETAQQKD